MKGVLPKYRWVILGITCFLCFISNYIQFQVSALAYVVMPELGITPVQFSSLLMAPMLIAVFLSIPSGMLGDQIGSKKVVGIGCIISVIGAFGRLYAGSFGTMMLMLSACGIAIAFLNANLIRVLGIWFQVETDKAMGYFYASSCAGIVLSQLTGTLFSSVPAAYMASSAGLLVGTVLWLILARDCPEGMEPAPPEPVMEYMKTAAKSKNTWIVAIVVGLGMGSTTAYAGILPQALIFGHGVNETLASSMAAIVTVGSFFGSLIGPMICSRLVVMKPFMMVTTLIGAVLMFVTWYTPIGFLMWAVLVLNGFFSATQGPILQSMPIQFPEIGEKYAGSAGGIIGTASLLISYVVPIVISAVAGENYALNLGLESLVFAAGSLCIMVLPELGSRKNGDLENGSDDVSGLGVQR